MTKKLLRGKVIRKNGNKTLIVKVSINKMHKKYGKIICFNKKYIVNNEKKETKIGDNVIIKATRPFSKHKKWSVNNK